MRAHPADVRALYLASVCALRARPHRHTRPPHKGARPPPRRYAHPPPGRRARPPKACVPPSLQACVPYTHGCTPPLDVRAPHYAGVCALLLHTYAPPLIAGVRALSRRRARPPPRWRARPTPLACVPPNSRARLPPRRHACPNPQTCAPPSSLACTPYPAGMCAPCRRARPLLAGVPSYPRRRARPPHPHARPLANVRALPASVRALPPQCARPHRWWQNKIYKEGSLTSPLHHAWLCVLGLLCGFLA
jgi:hypothetical protein